MQSDGGLSPLHSFSGSKAILSGPAGGVVGYALTTPVLSTSTKFEGEENKEESGKAKRAIIGFDMGGTSTDVSRFEGAVEPEGGEQIYEHVFETEIAGVSI